MEFQKKPFVMDVGKRYVVTRGSDDGTFEIGDHVLLDGDGALNCVEAMGWIDSEDVPDATAGMEVIIDKEWIELRKRALQKELNSLS